MDARMLYAQVVQDLTAGSTNRFVDRAEAGPVEVEALRRIAGEEYRIVSSDRRSFALLAARYPDAAPLFLSLAAGEGQALGLLVPYAEAVGLTVGDLVAYDPSPAAQGYPHYLAWLAQFGSRSDVALALLANFGFWGGYCARFAQALGRHHELTEDQVAFFTFFSSLPPGFEDAALTLLQTGLDAGDDQEGAKLAARMMQGYELAFWDALPIT
ncbi:transcriptional regulator [Streptomyces sp. SID3343]|uniref:transcriptional regulator n=1 Tax=Streptomyces sp. SID3343 TaxID=2690260 RepID=UPI001370C200|nr:transcriptional regulator [Streptomyces sp. SID3343]MYW00279.1 transcriptional regulator [Streptomyces sp. SID3343]